MTIATSARVTAAAVQTMLTTKDLAERWSVSAGSLANERATGRSAVPYVKIGERVRYRLSDILEYENRSIHGVDNNPVA